MEIEPQQFRDSDECVSGLTYAIKHRKWLCSDSLGQLYTLDTDRISSDWDRNNMIVSPVSSLALSPSENECAVASLSCVHIHSFPGVESVEQANAGEQVLH